MNLKTHTALLALLALPACCTATTPVAVNASSILWDFGLDTWVENIVQRPCGSLLVTTLFPNASVYQLSPPRPSSPTINNNNHNTTIQPPKLIYTFPYPSFNALGIAQISDGAAGPPESYAVATSGFDGSQIVNGSNQVWTLTFGSGGSSDKATAKRIATLPAAQLLNGLTTLPWDRAAVLVGDSFAGTVTRVDTRTGKSAVVLRGAALNASTPGTTALNGLKARVGAHRVSSSGSNSPACAAAAGSVYFTNAARTTLGSVLVAPDGTPARGCGDPVSTVALGGMFADDLAFVPTTGRGRGRDDGGVLLVATEQDRSILRVAPDGSVATAYTFPGAEGQGGPTALVFDRWRDGVVYVSSADGKVYRLDVSGVV